MFPALLPNFIRADLAFGRGDGAWLWAEDGRLFLDFGAGIATTSIGHGHPHLVDAITAGESVLRLTPPLVVMESDCIQGIALLRRAADR